MSVSCTVVPDAKQTLRRGAAGLVMNAGTEKTTPPARKSGY